MSSSDYESHSSSESSSNSYISESDVDDNYENTKKKSASIRHTNSSFPPLYQCDDVFYVLSSTCHVYASSDAWNNSLNLLAGFIHGPNNKFINL